MCSRKSKTLATSPGAVVIRRWLIRRHTDPDREGADKAIADAQLQDARQLRSDIADAAGRLARRKEENGFGAAVAASMQPKILRRLPWPR